MGALSARDVIDYATLAAMDDYRIPTTDGRFLTLRYDEGSGEMVLTVPEDADGQTSAALTLEGAERLVDALDEVCTRATGEPPLDQSST